MSFFTERFLRDGTTQEYAFLVAPHPLKKTGVIIITTLLPHSGQNGQNRLYQGGDVRQITTHCDLHHGRLSSRRTLKQKKRREETETVEK